MLGDSLTFRNSWNTMLNRSDILNKGIDGDTTHGVLYRLDYIPLEGIKQVCLMIGINDIAQGEVAGDIYDRYEMIVEYFSKKKLAIIVQSTLYVAADIYEADSMNAEVDSLNNKLEKLAKRENVIFANINRCVSKNGALQDGYSFDGVHLKPIAYEAWARCLKPVL